MSRGSLCNIRGRRKGGEGRRVGPLYFNEDEPRTVESGGKKKLEKQLHKLLAGPVPLCDLYGWPG
jgi:hypothetical protein